MADDFTLDEDIATFAMGDTLNSSSDLASAMEKQTLEDAQPNSSKNAKPKKKKKIAVRPIPIDLQVATIPINQDNIVTFVGKSDYLSSFFSCKINIGGILYPSVEQYYQATKLYSLCGPIAAGRLRACRFPQEAKVKAKHILQQFRVPYKTVDSWKNTQGVQVLLYANTLKFLQNFGLMEQLMETKEKLLVQLYEKDDVYACGTNSEGLMEWVKENEGKEFKYPVELKAATLDMCPLVGKGRNLSGMVLMRVRNIFKTYTTEQLKDRRCQEAILAKVIN
ncbi:unnamed protein product [Bursaphelenchus okinawaensis]|uniref:NADAR domain-containing protein n=1 Tax=Bursaphelenchus okinawaensis TaxID=465554 RepID=A0A811LSB9_9BILA|nr:unnamed protein product [Bursaphelenchus okinawaensis]CAG9127668.1 unnamed protein product [Bursaphelenchus okinawaensis]